MVCTKPVTVEPRLATTPEIRPLSSGPKHFEDLSHILCSQKYDHLGIPNCDQAHAHLIGIPDKAKKMVASSSTKSVKKELSLEDKWRLVDESDEKSQGQLAKKFGIGKR